MAGAAEQTLRMLDAACCLFSVFLSSPRECTCMCACKAPLYQACTVQQYPTNAIFYIGCLIKKGLFLPLLPLLLVEPALADRGQHQCYTLDMLPVYSRAPWRSKLPVPLAPDANLELRLWTAVGSCGTQRELTQARGEHAQKGP